MNTYLTASLFTLTSLVFAATIAPGCTSTACSDLADLCANCPSPAYRADCEETVANGVESVCSGQKPTYELFCPDLPGTGGSGGASSTSAGGSPANGSGGSGTGAGGSGTGAGGTGGTPSGAGGSGGSGGG